MEITYVTENPSPQYAKAIRAAKTRQELIAAITPYKPIADDALACAHKFSDQDFSDFQRDIKKASRKMPSAWVEKFNERFGAIALPTKLVISTLVEQQFSVPWGCAFIRCDEEGWPMLKKSQKA